MSPVVGLSPREVRVALEALRLVRTDESARDELGWDVADGAAALTASQNLAAALPSDETTAL